MGFPGEDLGRSIAGMARFAEHPKVQAYWQMHHGHGGGKASQPVPECADPMCGNPGEIGTVVGLLCEGCFVAKGGGGQP